MRAAGRSICAIAGALQRAKSTVSRELRRNALPSGRYSPLHAAGAYQLRRRREAILEKGPTLRTFVRDRLAEGWAPEQIAGWLKAGNDARTEAGHWEGDLIICKRTRPVLVLHERKRDPRCAARRKDGRRDHLGHAGDLRSHKTGAAQINHFR